MSIKKDWNGNKRTAYAIIGASNHCEEERQSQDYYATDPDAIDALEKVFDKPQNVWECACGQGHLSERLRGFGHNVYSSDLIDRGYGEGKLDFLQETKMPDGIECILTNPPYNKALQFVLHSLELLEDGQYCIMFLKTTFLEGKKRYIELFSKYPPKYVFQFVNRMLCAKNGDFETASIQGSAVAYAWFIWEKGYDKETIVKWIK